MTYRALMFIDTILSAARNIVATQDWLAESPGGELRADAIATWEQLISHYWTLST